jgi:hypothetical protein
VAFGLRVCKGGLTNRLACLLGSSLFSSYSLLKFSLLAQAKHFLEGLFVLKQEEVGGNSRSVMPLDVLERTRVTIEKVKSL